MDIKDFIKDFGNALDDLDLSSLKAETKIHDLPQLDSLGVLSLIAMMHKNYQTKVKGSEIKNAVTIADLYNLILPH
jgi:acyl carrier protein